MGYQTRQCSKSEKIQKCKINQKNKFPVNFYSELFFNILLPPL